MPPQIQAARPQTGRGGTMSTGGSGFRGTGPFKPPRPVKTAGTRTATVATAESSSASKSAPADRRVDVAISDDEDDAAADENSDGAATDVATENVEDDDGGGGKSRARAKTNARTDKGAVSEAVVATPAIPPALLARILHHFFQNPGGATTRLTQDAHTVVDKYMEIFIREAVARSVAERGDGAFLDVDVLQKIAGQLILDM